MSGPEPIMHESGRTTWQNWHHNYEVSVRRLVDVWNGDPGQSSVEGYRATTAGLQRLIGESLEAGDGVRALGAGWSLSRAPVTRGTMVNTKPLNYRFPIRATSVHPDYPREPDDLYLVQCGNHVSELNRFLFQQGKSLPTSGASNGQTIAGALSTGTHGAAVDFGTMAEFVEAIHLIPGPDRHVWLERSSRPAVRDEVATDTIGADLLRDDALFEAALIAFGSFGLIHGLVIAAEDQFFLNAYRQRRPLPPLRATLDDLEFGRVELPRPERPWHFEVVINPFEPDRAYVTTMYRDAERRPGSRPPDPSGRIGPGDDALAVIAALTDKFTIITPVLVAGLLAAGYEEYENVSGTPGQIFGDTGTRGRAASTAVGVPLGRVNEALEAVLEVQEEVGAPVLVSLRYVRSTDGTLGFAYQGERCCVLEIDGPRSADVCRTYQRSWRELRSRGFPLPFHWGKQHDLTPSAVRTAYGESRVDAWLAARRELLDTPELREAFSNEMLERMDLHD